MVDFESWFYGCDEDTFGLRAEYFYQDVVDPMSELTRMTTLREWMKAAFDAGKKAASE